MTLVAERTIEGGGAGDGGSSSSGDRPSRHVDVVAGGAQLLRPDSAISSVTSTRAMPAMVADHPGGAKRRYRPTVPGAEGSAPATDGSPAER